jgi:uncharacterized protein
MEMVKKEDGQDKIVIDDKLLIIPSPTYQTGALLGNRCRVCGESFFPSRYCCRNCTSDNMEEVLLSTKGTLYAFTKIRVNLPNSRVAPPFLVGIIELPEGEKIEALLADCDSDTVRIGDEMELKIEPVFIDEKGNEVLGWKFRPGRKQQ